MTFLALDSNRHYHTAKVFGINLNHYREKTAVLIYDLKVILQIVQLFLTDFRKYLLYTHIF